MGAEAKEVHQEVHLMHVVDVVSAHSMCDSSSLGASKVAVVGVLAT